MNTPNPLHPQGAFPDARTGSHVRIAVFTILAIHVVLLGALLLQGCKKSPPEAASGTEGTAPLPAFVPTTNTVVPPPDIAPFVPPPEVARIEPPPSAPSPAPAPPDEPTKVEPPPLAPPAEPAKIEPAPPAVASPPAGPAREHIVVKGDSFYALAKQYHVTSKAIAEANPGVDPRRLKIDTTLIIPPPVEPPAPKAADRVGADGARVYKVKSGDNLTTIARRFGTDVKTLRRENNLRTDRLLVDQELKIPASAKSPPKTDASATAKAPK
ncbi:MAG: LysM peptidoglycan-binding domain-containing protein [Verrucomicrobia bacterium]|nr:LysM peptidoglycan-binding domain-containing protein [Verrucomicrobiota bacterium]